MLPRLRSFSRRGTRPRAPADELALSSQDSPCPSSRSPSSTRSPSASSMRRCSICASASSVRRSTLSSLRRCDERSSWRRRSTSCAPTRRACPTLAARSRHAGYESSSVFLRRSTWRRSRTRQTSSAPAGSCSSVACSRRIGTAFRSTPENLPRTRRRARRGAGGGRPSGGSRLGVECPACGHVRPTVSISRPSSAASSTTLRARHAREIHASPRPTAGASRRSSRSSLGAPALPRAVGA